MCEQNIFDDDTFFVVIKNFAEMTQEARAEEVRQESEKARKEQEEKNRLEQEYIMCIDNYNNAVE